ncbi:MAG: 1-deoxy-D-xylulose-5-phosphate synthase [Planctomycetota bacterium]
MAAETTQACVELVRGIAGPHDLKRLPVDRLSGVAVGLREIICDQIQRTGGHFASNLGVVELTIALHYAFDFSRDRLLWDVGHQCYPHKLLTGRQDLFPNLKLKGGMAGFPEPRESDYDLFSVGHAGSSISTGVGLAIGDAARGQADRKTVCVIGDSSIINGVAMEGLNAAGTLQRQFLTVLNDNGRAIGDPQGALAQYFDRVRTSHALSDLKKRAKRALDRLPGGSVIEEAYHKGGRMLRTLIATDHLFEHFGHVCIGPVDGHDVAVLVELMEELREIDRPILLHVKTTKGKGFHLSEADPFRFHAPKPAQFAEHRAEQARLEQALPDEMEVSDCRVEKKQAGKSFTHAFADALIEVMHEDDAVHAITAAMPDGTGLDKVMPVFPDRTHDCGLAESHGMAKAAGMAKAGLKPFYAVYSTFSQRALDQTFQEVALQGLPVRICMDRAGYVGGDGSMMHGFMDIAMNAVFPNAVLMAAMDEPSMLAALRFMAGYDDGPTFLRYPRDVVAEGPVGELLETPAFELGKAVRVRGGNDGTPDLAILGFGHSTLTALDAASKLEAERGLDIAVWDARFAKPLDIDLIKSLVEAGVPIVTVEDHGRVGGFGSLVLETLNDLGLPTDKLRRIGHPPRWMYHDSRGGQLRDAGLDANGVAEQIATFLDDLAQRAAEVRVEAQLQRFAEQR